MSDPLFLKQRKIIHIDMDCFYAAVEMRDNPQYKNIPLAIAGHSERRGVLSTCNYRAREYGLHSAMASFKAKQLCPELVIIPGRMAVYVAVSKKIKEIFFRYTSLVEPLSLDEAFLDVSDSTLFQGSATYIAQDIRRAIFEELHLTASAGVAPCKFLAKIASDENKPNGQFVIPPQDVKAFVDNLALKKIPGVGKVTQQKLALKGLYSCTDIQRYDAQKLCLEFGKLGHSLLNYCEGIDERIIEPNRERKSLAVEVTFEQDLMGESACEEKLVLFFKELTLRLQKLLNEKIITKLAVKVKFSDFSVKSAERKSTQLSLPLFKLLMHHLLHKSPDKAVRLIGLSVGLAARCDNKQQRKQQSEQLSFTEL